MSDIPTDGECGSCVLCPTLVRTGWTPGWSASAQRLLYGMLHPGKASLKDLGDACGVPASSALRTMTSLCGHCLTPVSSLQEWAFGVPTFILQCPTGFWSWHLSQGHSFHDGSRVLVHFQLHLPPGFSAGWPRALQMGSGGCSSLQPSWNC